jgi:hypothetical protein
MLPFESTGYSKSTRQTMIAWRADRQPHGRGCRLKFKTSAMDDFGLYNFYNFGLNNFGLHRRRRVSTPWLYSSIMVSQYYKVPVKHLLALAVIANC